MGVELNPTKGHCRRRKIRCIPSQADFQGRCVNCIRLKKECSFYPVDPQPPPYPLTMPSISPPTQPPGSESYTPDSKRKSLTLVSPPQRECLSDEDWPTKAFQAPLSPQPYDYGRHGTTNWMCADASPSSSKPSDLNATWRSYPVESPITPAFSSFTPDALPLSVTWSAPVASESSPRDDIGWYGERSPEGRKLWQVPIIPIKNVENADTAWRTFEAGPVYWCRCGRDSKRKDNFSRHIKTCVSNPSVRSHLCSCQYEAEDADAMLYHLANCGVRELSRSSNTSGDIKGVGDKGAITAQLGQETTSMTDGTIIGVGLLRRAISTGNRSQVESLLGSRFKEVAQGEFIWLLDLEETGFGVSEMAKLLFDATNLPAECPLALEEESRLDPEDHETSLSPEADHHQATQPAGYSVLMEESSGSNLELLEASLSLYVDNPFPGHQEACAHRIPNMHKALGFDVFSHTTRRNTMQRRVATMCGLAGMIPEKGQQQNIKDLTIAGPSASVVYGNGLPRSQGYTNHPVFPPQVRQTRFRPSNVR